MKKGFTIIELLAVIAILGIILLVTIPIVVNMIETTRINAYKNTENELIKAARSYYAENYKLLPKEYGDSIEITITELNNQKLIKNVKNENGNCNGYVIVTNIDEGKYDYNPQLKCGSSNNISSSSDDKLISYYKFDNNLYDYSLNNHHAANYGDNDNLFDYDINNIDDCAVNFHSNSWNYLLAPIVSISEKLSICSWIYPRTYGDDYKTIVTGRNSASFYLSIHPSGYLATYWYSTSPSGYHYGTNNIVDVNQWNYICVVWDGSFNYIYKNGRLINKVSVAGAGAASVNLNIGAESVFRQFNGKLDSLRIYNRDLSSEEINYFYKLKL